MEISFSTNNNDVKDKILNNLNISPLNYKTVQKNYEISSGITILMSLKKDNFRIM